MDQHEAFGKTSWARELPIQAAGVVVVHG